MDIYAAISRLGLCTPDANLAIRALAPDNTQAMRMIRIRGGVDFVRWK